MPRTKRHPRGRAWCSEKCRLGLLDGLPPEDQQAIVDVVGKPVLLNEYNDEETAELQFTDGNGVIHLVYVSRSFIRPSDVSLADSHVTFRSPIPSHHWRLEERTSIMKRTFAIILAALAAAALFGGLVHAVLVAAHVSEPAATTVYGLTPRRLWATTAALLALAGVVIGGLALARPGSRFGVEGGRLGAFVALVAGLVAALNGGLNLAIANGGPGTGNGVVGGSAAFVLGLIALTLGGVALARCRRTTSEPGRMA